MEEDPSEGEPKEDKITKPDKEKYSLHKTEKSIEIIGAEILQDRCKEMSQ